MKKTLLVLCCSVLPFSGVLADNMIETVDKAAAEAMANDQAPEAGNVAIMEKEVESAENSQQGIERYEQFQKSLEKAKTD